MRRMICTLMIAAAAAACGRGSEPVEPGTGPVNAQAGDTITLKYGQAAYIGGDVRVIFRAVEADSRCPINVVCVWAGDAEIRIDVANTDGVAWGALVLHTNGEPRSASIGDYVIELVEVAPARVAPDDLKPSDYSVRLAISRG